MKKLFLLSLILTFSFGLSITPVFAGSAASHPNTSAIANEQFNQKEIQKQLQQSKRGERLQKFMSKRVQKIEKKLSKKGFGDLDRNLQLCLVFLLAAVLLSILSYFIGFLWILSSLAALASAIFFVLWLIDYLA